MVSDRLRLIYIPKRILISRQISWKIKSGGWDQLATYYIGGYFFDTPEIFLAELIKDGLPDGFKVEQASFDLDRCALGFAISHSSFDPVPEGNLLTPLPVRFKPVPEIN